MPAQTGLVLHAAGALGAFEVGALKRLYENRDFAPDIISATSIGAVNAACIVGGREHPIKTLTQVWGRFSISSAPMLPQFYQRILSLYGNPNFFSMRPNYLAPFWTSFYDNLRLRRVLQECIDFGKLNSSPINLIISAADTQTGQTESFDNRQTRLTIDHILAACSLPPAFPATKVNGKSYWDGGLFCKSSLAPIIERMVREVSKHLYVINLLPNHVRPPQDMLAVFARIIEILFSNQVANDVKTAERIDEFAEAMAFVEKHMPAAALKKARAMPGYRRLTGYKLIKNLTVISDTDPASASGPLDFSEQTIARRIDAGYRAAARALPSRAPATPTPAARPIPAARPARRPPRRRQAAGAR